MRVFPKTPQGMQKQQGIFILKILVLKLLSKKKTDLMKMKPNMSLIRRDLVTWLLILCIPRRSHKACSIHQARRQACGAFSPARSHIFHRGQSCSQTFSALSEATLNWCVANHAPISKLKTIKNNLKIKVKKHFFT